MAEQPGWFVTPIIAEGTAIRKLPRLNAPIAWRVGVGDALRVLPEDLDNGREKIGIEGQWLAVSGHDGIPGFVPAWHVQVAVIRKPGPLVPVGNDDSTDNRVASTQDIPVDELLLKVYTDSDIGLRLRSGPGLNFEQLGWLPQNQIAFVPGDITANRAKLGQQGEWVFIRTIDGLEGFSAAWLLAEVGTEPPRPKIATFEFGHALVGLHGPADPGAWPWDEGALNLLRIAKIEAVKVMAWGDLDARVIAKIKEANVKFIMARIFHKFPQPQTAASFAEEVAPAVKRVYEAGVRYFEVHNEPNLHADNVPEGMWVNWANGREFGEFFLESVALLRGRFPEGKFGWPGISPGPDASLVPGGPQVRYSSERFLNEGDFAIREADWIGMHTYWGLGGLNPEHSLSDVKSYCERYPNKVIFATEFSNNLPGFDKAKKGEQYAEFYRGLRSMPANFGGAFSFVLSSSAGFEDETWRDTAVVEKVRLRGELE